MHKLALEKEAYTRRRRIPYWKEAYTITRRLVATPAPTPAPAYVASPSPGIRSGQNCRPD